MNSPTKLAAPRPRSRASPARSFATRHPHASPASPLASTPASPPAAQAPRSNAAAFLLRQRTPPRSLGLASLAQPAPPGPSAPHQPEPASHAQHNHPLPPSTPAALPPPVNRLPRAVCCVLRQGTCPEKTFSAGRQPSKAVCCCYYLLPLQLAPGGRGICPRNLASSRRKPSRIIITDHR